MKKILIISSSSSHTLKFIEMMEDKYEITVITNDKKTFEEYKINEIFLWKKNWIKNIFYTYSIVEKIKPDLIHIQQVGMLAFYYTFLLHRRYKILVTAWGSDVMVFPYTSKLKNLMTKYVLNNVSYVSSINSIGIMSVIKCLTNFKKNIIPINFGISKYVEFEEDTSKKENIIYSPRSHKDLYNIEMIVTSFAQLIKKESKWKLYLSGIEDKINTPKFKTLVDKLMIEDNVVFLGLVSQKENAMMMKRSKIVVSVPITDGRPISVMEAIASNCTLICSNILANKELVEDGLNGIIVNHTKIFDMLKYKDIDLDMQTKYNYKISQNFQYKNTKVNFLNILDGVINDDYNR